MAKPVHIELYTKLRARTRKARSGCWSWTKSVSTSGYGLSSYRRLTRERYAHRLMFMAVHGEIPAGLFVCHRCDNRKCVNPKHLWAGTQQDNITDAQKKGRTAGPRYRGFEHPLHKPVYCPETDTVYGGAADAARKLNLWQPLISKVLRGRRPHTEGYTFKYV